MQRGFRLARALPVHTQRSARFRVAQQTRTFAEQSNATAGAKETVQNAKNKAASAFDKFPKHPDYEGVEAIFRYYMPHNYQLSMFVMGFYVTLISLAIMRSKMKNANEKANAPPPEFPDFHTVKEVSEVPSIENEEWESWIEEDEENIEKWILAAAEADEE